MPNTLVTIYVLRSQCKKHNLDTMRTFTLKGNESPDEAYIQMERYVARLWPTKYKCDHKIKFTRSIEKDYRYNTKLKQVEAV